MAADEGVLSPLRQGSDVFEARVRQLYRYAQVGRSVNGVTHELNNYLGAVMAYSELVALDEGLSDESRRMLGEVLNGVRRASELLSTFTGIARKEKKTECLVDARNMLEHVVAIQAYAARAGRIEVIMECPSSLPAFMGDLPKLELALNYVMVNSMDAMAQAGQGSIRLRAACADGWISLAVKDSAPPIPEALRAPMFDPYVTTFDGPHIGLGLTLAREIAELHGGTLTYSPEDGFEMRLPLEAPAD
jgi:signal transduction histidine kinase